MTKLTFRSDSDSSIGFYILMGLLVFAPLVRGGNRPLPLMVLELLALVLWVVLYFRWQLPTERSWLFKSVLLVIFLLPLLQLIPLPPEWWQRMPGRSFYADALRLVNDGLPFDGYRTVSLFPWGTESAGYALLVPLVVFFFVLSLSSSKLPGLVNLFLGIATLQAILGLIQYGHGADSPFRFGSLGYNDSATGTYVNRNHLAGLLEMALPLTIAMLVATVGSSSNRFGGGAFAKLGNIALNRAILYGAVLVAILLGLIFTRSRAGISLGMLGILICTLIFANRLGGRNVYGLLGTIVFIGLGFSILIGLSPVLDRFALNDPATDSRWSIFSSTLEGASHFFPLGSGAGTFVEVYPRFRLPDVIFGGIVNRAHNDYLEIYLETGVIGGLLILLLFGYYLWQCRIAFTADAWSKFQFIQVGTGIGLLLLLIHSIVDFNLHIPANAVFFAFFAGIFFHQQAQRGNSHRPSVQRQRSERKKPLQPLKIPTFDNIPNPFSK